VAINIAASVPIIGPFIYHFLSDGSTLGTLTLGRFFGLHVWATPAAIIGLVGLHLFIFRHNSSAGPPVDEPAVKFGRFYPNQIFMDTVASVLAFAIIVVLAFVMPAPLLAKADPNNAQFIPAPAWYFYALYGLLRMFPQNLSLVPTVILPGLFTMVLLLLPWLDRNPHRALARRPFTIPFAILSVALLIGITVYSAKIIGDEIAKSPVGQTPVEGYGAPPSQATVPTIALTYPQAAAAAAPVGANVFAQNCASCHGAEGKGTPGSFPPLAGNPFVTGDPNKVTAAVLHGMKGPIVVNGVSFSGAIPMPAWSSKLSPAEVAAVVTYIRSAWGNHASAVTPEQVKAISK